MADDGGLSSFQRRMQAIPLKARQAVQPALEKGAAQIVKTQKQLAPNDDHTLERSIRQQEGIHELSRIITAGGLATTKVVRNGSTATYDYALAQEHGTAKMAANPFFWPGYRLERKMVAAAIKRAIGKAVKATK